MAKAKGKGAGKKSGTAKRRPGFMVPGDPPIIVGGGGSSWIWIRREANLQIFNPLSIPATITPPDNAIKPTNPGLYHLLHLPGVTLTEVHFRDGEENNEGNHGVPNSANGKKKHRTFFVGTM